MQKPGGKRIPGTDWIDNLNRQRRLAIDHSISCHCARALICQRDNHEVCGRSVKDAATNGFRRSIEVPEGACI